MASIKLFATDEQVNKHGFVWIDPGTESEAHWRGKGYLSEAEIAETKAKAEEMAKAAQAEETAAHGETGEVGGMRRRGRPRAEG